MTGDDTDNELKGRDGNDTLTAGAGNDRISFGSGNDLAIGGLGDDTYRYYAKDGFNIIQETGGFDTILFHEEHSEAGWGSPYREGDDLVYVTQNGLSGFRVEGHFADPDKSIEMIHFEGAEGGSYSVLVRNDEQAVGNAQHDEMIIGTTDDDMLTGVAGDNIRHDEFYGYHGNDTIDNSAGGASWIEGGTGNDTITGGVSEDLSLIHI